jgi:hypothetical protein
MTANNAYLAGLQSELAAHRASSIAEPGNKDWARRIKEVEHEIKRVSGVETATVDTATVETTTMPPAKPRKKV